MKGDATVIDLLNEVLTGELTAINQYFVHAKMCKNWGFKKLASYIHHESIDEMKHADVLVDRILFLEGLPNLQRISKLQIGTNVPEILKNDYAVELTAIPLLKKAIAHCRSVGDHASEDLLLSILKAEEEHVDWLEAQFDLIKQVGEQNYLAQQIH